MMLTCNEFPIHFTWSSHLQQRFQNIESIYKLVDVCGTHFRIPTLFNDSYSPVLRSIHDAWFHYEILGLYKGLVGSYYSFPPHRYSYYPGKTTRGTQTKMSTNCLQNLPGKLCIKIYKFFYAPVNTHLEGESRHPTYAIWRRVQARGLDHYGTFMEYSLK